MWPRIGWTRRSVDHVARHGVSVEEVERAREGPCVIRRAGDVFVAIGASHGRLLFIVFKPTEGRRRCYVITARDATTAEKRIYRRKAKR